MVTTGQATGANELLYVRWVDHFHHLILKCPLCPDLKFYGISA